MDTYVPPILDITNRGAYITLDLRFNYYNSFGTVIRSDLIGVFIGNFMNDNINKPIFWKDFDSVNNINKILLNGNYINPNQTINILRINRLNLITFL